MLDNEVESQMNAGNSMCVQCCGLANVFSRKRNVV